MSTDNQEIKRPIETQHFDSASDFVSALRRTDPYWLTADDWGFAWLFRGESTDQRALIPTAWRDSIQADDVFRTIDQWDFDAHMTRLIEEPQYKGMKLEEHRDNLRRLLVHTTFESYIVRVFEDLVDDLGLPIPGGKLPPFRPVDPFAWLKNFRWPDSLEASDTFHPVVALAQHHKMPTRLLDWTENPLIAAYFAAEKATVNDEGNLIVWAANRQELRNTAITELAVERSQIGYLQAQEGLFTFISRANLLFLWNGRWPRLEDCAREGTLRRLTLPRSQGPELRRLLRTERISKAHLMPTLDNIKEALKDYWQHAFGKKLPALKEAEQVATAESAKKTVNVDALMPPPGA
jgi:hypothetical protein